MTELSIKIKRGAIGRFFEGIGLLKPIIVGVKVDGFGSIVTCNLKTYNHPVEVAFNSLPDGKATCEVVKMEFDSGKTLGPFVFP